MKTFSVTLEKVYRKTIYVEAENIDEACEKVMGYVDNDINDTKLTEKDLKSLSVYESRIKK